MGVINFDRLIIIVVSLAAIAFIIGIDRRGASKLEAFKAESASIIAASEAKLVVVDSLTVAAEAASRRADASEARVRELERIRPLPQTVVQLKTEIDSLKAVAKDSVELARTVIPAQDSIIAIQAETIRVDSLIKTELVTVKNDLTFARNNLLAANETLRADNVTLRTQLASVPSSDTGKILWLFNPPTRRESFIIGVVLGAAAVIAVTH